jgi:hypothetical protein
MSACLYHLNSTQASARERAEQTAPTTLPAVIIIFLRKITQQQRRDERDHLAYIYSRERARKDTFMFSYHMGIWWCETQDAHGRLSKPECACLYLIAKELELYASSGLNVSARK